MFGRLGDERGLANSAWLEWVGTGSCLQTAAATTAGSEGAAHARAAGDFVLARSLQRTAQARDGGRPRAHVDEAMTAAEMMLADAGRESASDRTRSG